MTINEQLKKLKPHVDDIRELFICLDDWANTSDGELYAECHAIEDFDSFLKRYGELKSLDWCVIYCQYYRGLGIGFVVASTDL